LKGSYALAIIAGLIIASIAGTLIYQNLTTPPTLEPVTVGHVPVESFALLYIAQQQGYFTTHGLNVTISDYATGTVAAQALTSGTVDIAGSSEYVVAYNAIEKQNISVVASLGEAQIVDLIASNHSGITQPSDLKGKTIATAKSTVAEFDLGLFLQENGLTLQDINLVYFPPGQSAAAISNNSVDAVVTWQLYSEQVKMALSDGYMSWPLQTHEPFFSVLSCRNDWLTSHSQIVNKLLLGLADAQSYIENHPSETQQVIKARFNYTDSYITSVWPRNNCTLTLTQKMLDVMSDEAAWMINNRLTTQKTMPNLQNYIDSTQLKVVKPEAVTIP
jgi:ABC-type nitrate/sulfonate/bicarbonate transport system substrate-binding protein